MPVPASTRAKVYRMFERWLEARYPGTIWTVSEDDGPAESSPETPGQR